MSRNENGVRPRKVFDKLAHRADLVRIQADRRFVQDDELGLVHQGVRQADALPVPFGKMSDDPPADVGQRALLRDGIHPLLRAFSDRGPLTLLHGDLRAENLFFTPAPDRDLVAIDWQIAVIGRAAYDVGYLMAQSVTSEIRKTHEQQVLQEYHAALVAHGATGYSLEDAWDDYRRTILWSLVYPVGAISEDLTDPRALERIGTIARRIMHAIADLDATEMLIP